MQTTHAAGTKIALNKEPSLIVLSWSDVENTFRLRDGDVIHADSVPAVNQWTTELCLQLSGPITWWKEIQLLNDSDEQMGFIEASGKYASSGPLQALNTNLTPGGKIVLWKAKAFGARTPMYVLAGLDHIAGKRITFTWSAD